MTKLDKLSKNKGFTLVEVAIVLVIGGLIVSFAAASLQRYIKTSQINATKEKLDQIDNALQQYLSINSKLPCPARRNDAIDTANFGREIDGVNCSTVGAVAGESVDVNGAAGRVVKIGVLPVRSMGLPDDFMLDSWGNRFTYAVTARMAQRATYDSTEGDIRVEDANGNPILTDAHYVIISHGPNGNGAVIASGQGVMPCGGGVEAENCDDANATFANTTLFSEVAANEFDDFVKYRTGSVLQSNIVPTGAVVAFDLAGGCPVGWTDYAHATGRVIRGANPAAGYNLYDSSTTVPAGGVGPATTGTGLDGVEQHVLNYSDATLPNEVAVQVAANTVDLAGVAAAYPGVDALLQPTAATAAPHPNLPPVINLFYCRKN